MSRRERELLLSSDEVLMEAYVAGHLGAHRILFERFAPAIFVFARQRLSDPAEAEDIVQCTFLALHRARFDYRRGARVRPWIFTIVLNLVRDAARRRVRRREDVRLVEPSSEVRDFERDRRHDIARVRRALERLPADQRRAVELHWIEERPFGEVAALVGVSVSAVKVRAHRGYARMRSSLAGEKDDR